MRKISERKMEEETGDWRKVRNEELRGFAPRVMKARRTGWAGVCCVWGEKIMHTESWWENHLEDLGMDGRIVLKWALKRGLNGLIWLTIGIVAGLCEHGTEPSCSIKCI
jgi:hypothetical protein